ncbi:MAG: hypothetical protein GX795_00820 [Firmicutes bacterium]|nr:hypothetical protein [Bacillota bacterium]
MARLLRRSPEGCRMLIVAMVITLAMLAFAVKAGGEGIQVETGPQVIRKAVLQGETSTFQVEVTNKGSVPVEIVPEVVDLSIDEHGQNVELPEGTDYDWGLKEFARIFPEKFMLKPGETRIAEVRVKAPRSLSGGRYGILYFAASDPSAKGRIIMVVRCGSLLLITVPGTETYSGRVQDIRLVPRQGRESSLAGFEVVFENTGNVHMSATGHIKISDGKDTLVNMALRGGTGTILPGGTRLYRVGLREDIPDGEYEVTVDFVFEGKAATARRALRIRGGQAYLE